MYNKGTEERGRAVREGSGAVWLLFAAVACAVAVCGYAMYLASKI